jgi:hypothetical protein
MECILYLCYLNPNIVPTNLCINKRVILLNYREDGITPFFTIWKDGLTEMKV